MVSSFHQRPKNLISKAVSGKNNPMFGKTHNEEVKAKISKVHLVKIVTIDTKLKISKVLSGELNPMFGEKHKAKTLTKMSASSTSELHPLYEKTHSIETLAKMSAAQGTTIYVYSTDKCRLINTFYSANKAGGNFLIAIIRQFKNMLRMDRYLKRSGYCLQP